MLQGIPSQNARPRRRCGAAAWCRVVLCVVTALALGFLVGAIPRGSAAKEGCDRAADAQSPCLERFEFRSIEMAVPVRIVCYHDSKEDAQAASQAAFDRFGELNAIFSDYHPDSEARRLGTTAGSGKAVPVSDELWEVLTLSHELSEASNGAFDVTVGPYVRLWRRARALHEMPPEWRFEEAKERSGFDKIRMDPQQRTVELTAPEMKLDFGGIAKGYAIDESIRILRRHGISRVLVDAGGDIGLGDPPPGRDTWNVGIAPLERDAEPSHFVRMNNCAVATSGDRYQYIRIDGVRYSHIVDPRTGRGLTESSEVTVISPDATLADALATTVSVMGPEKGIPLAEEHPGTAVLVLRNRDGKCETVRSPRWQKWLREGKLIEGSTGNSPAF